MRRRGRACRGRRAGPVSALTPTAAESGAGLIGTSLGVLFFLGFLLVAAQLGVSAYASTVLGTAAYDGGRVVAGAAGDDGVLDGAELAAAERRATARVADLIGPAATFEVIRVDSVASTVEVRVTAPRPRLLPGGGTIGSEQVSRRAVLRLEQLQ